MLKFKLWEKFKQPEALDFCFKRCRAILALGVGGGKTPVSLALIDKLKQECGAKFVLVTAGNSSAEDTWVRLTSELTDFTYSLNNIDPTKDINIYSYSQINYLPQELKGVNLANSVLILDESHILKSSTSQQARFFRGERYGDGQRGAGFIDNFTYAYGLTGTPFSNHIEELYWMIESFAPGYYTSLAAFMQNYTIQVKRSRPIADPRFPGGKRYEDYYEVIGYKNLEHLAKSLDPIMFRHIIDYNIDFKFSYCDLTPTEAGLYKLAGAGMLRESMRSHGGRLPDLQQVVNGSITSDGEYNSEQFLSTKEQVLVDELNAIGARGEGALVFTEYKSTMRRFKFLRTYLKNFEQFYFMSGDVHKNNRSPMARSLKPKECMFLTTDVGGESLNLQAVNNVIAYDMPWAVHELAQLLGRITRSDSTYEKFNARFICVRGTIDEYKLAVISANANLFKKLIGGMAFIGLYFDQVQKSQIEGLRKSLLWGR